jgi:hypothetical protein
VSKDFDTLTMLWKRAADHLDEGELKEIANLDEHASFLAGNLSDVVEEIGCTVMANDNPENNSGNFNSAGDVSTPLFSIASQIDHINGLFRLSAEAGHRLRKSETKATKGGTKS